MTKKQTRRVKPFYKWVGGKDWLADTILKHVRPQTSVYCEPFLGGGAVFWRLLDLGLGSNIRFRLSDINLELITTWHELGSRLETRSEAEVFKPLKEMAELHSEDYYYKVRKSSPSAARFLYLNKAGFNGLYRVNKAGVFNTPFGHRKYASFDYDLLRECAYELRNLWESDRLVVAGSNWDMNLHGVLSWRGPLHHVFVYLDPPYVRCGDSKFTEYVNSIVDAHELFRVGRLMADRGATVVISNSWCDLTLGLCSEFKVEAHEISKNRTVGASGRRKVSELLGVFKS